MYVFNEGDLPTRIVVHPPTPPQDSEHAFRRFDSPRSVHLPAYQADDVDLKRRKETQPELTFSAPKVNVSVNVIVDDTSTDSATKPKEPSDAPEPVRSIYQVKSRPSSLSSRSSHSVQTSSPRFSVWSGPFPGSPRPASQASITSSSPRDGRSRTSRSSASILRRRLSDQDSGRESFPRVTIHDNVSLTGNPDVFGVPPAVSDGEVFSIVTPDSATSGLARELPFEYSNRKRQNHGQVPSPSVIVVEKALMFAEVLETPFPPSPNRGPVVGDESNDGSAEAPFELTMPTGSCLFSRTFDQELDELEDGMSLLPVRLATTPTASMFAETSSSLRAFVGYHYPADFLPRMFWNYNLGRLIALTRFDSVTGESGTVFYSEAGNGKYGISGRKEWEYRGRIVSTVWEATPKLRGRGKDALQTIYIKTLAKNDPRQLYNPLFLHSLRARYPHFPELIGEWETVKLHVVVVRNCGLALQKRRIWDRILQRTNLDVDWPLFIR